MTNVEITPELEKLIETKVLEAVNSIVSNPSFLARLQVNMQAVTTSMLKETIERNDEDDTRLFVTHQYVAGCYMGVIKDDELTMYEQCPEDGRPAEVTDKWNELDSELLGDVKEYLIPTFIAGGARNGEEFFVINRSIAAEAAAKAEQWLATMAETPREVVGTLVD